MFCGTQDTVCRLLKVLGFGKINILDKFLRIAINQREPRALNLNHDPVSLFETMKYVEQFQVHLSRNADFKRCRMLKRISKPATYHLAPNHHLIVW